MDFGREEEEGLQIPHFADRWGCGLGCVAWLIRALRWVGQVWRGVRSLQELTTRLS